jgi:hypothetical protein
MKCISMLIKSTAIAVGFVAISIHAQNYSVDWFTIDGGGGMSTGGVYTLNSAIGQPDAGGPMLGGGYSLTGGFWSLLSVTQTPGASKLTITLVGPTVAMVSWPAPSTGFVLQQNTNLNFSVWLPPPQVINDDGTNKFIIVNPAAGMCWYRLIK